MQRRRGQRDAGCGTTDSTERQEQLRVPVGVAEMEVNGDDGGGRSGRRVRRSRRGTWCVVGVGEAADSAGGRWRERHPTSPSEAATTKL
jgi:hypothetical protein